MRTPSLSPAPVPEAHAARRRRWLGSAACSRRSSPSGRAGRLEADVIRGRAGRSASQPEAIESVELAAAREREHRGATTAIGTVAALRSVTLRNELAGRFARSRSSPGRRRGGRAARRPRRFGRGGRAGGPGGPGRPGGDAARAGRARARQNRGASEADVDRAQAELDVARARSRARGRSSRGRRSAPPSARASAWRTCTRASTWMRAASSPRCRASTTTAHVDFTVTQDVAAGLREGDRLEVVARASESPTPRRRSSRSTRASTRHPQRHGARPRRRRGRARRRAPRCASACRSERRGRRSRSR